MGNGRIEISPQPAICVHVMVTLMLQVDLQRLRALPGAEAEVALEKLASLRSVLLGLPIRCCI